MKGFDKTSVGIFELIYKSLIQPIKLATLLTKTRSQTFLEEENRQREKQTLNTVNRTVRVQSK